MLAYVIRRLILLPITLFAIVLVNFVIINLAPGDPTTQTEISEDGSAKRHEDQSVAFSSDTRYLQFREHYGLTLPILFNTWPSMSVESVRERLEKLLDRDSMTVDAYDRLRVDTGDRSKFILPQLFAVAKHSEGKLKELALQFIVRGGTRQGHVGASLSKKERQDNRSIAKSNQFLHENIKDLGKLEDWYSSAPKARSSMTIFFLETRFCCYFSRVLTLDFGTLRNDQNRKVIDEVTSRFKYSLTLAVLPMLLTFVLCQVFGFYMAVNQGKSQDLFLNMGFLILYATPVFVVAPFLIEKVALNRSFPFTETAIPISGFTSPAEIYEGLSSWGRLWDTLQHIALPLVAIMYGSLAVQSRLSRTAVLEVLRQDYVRTARAKGLSTFQILFKHVGRNAAITIVTSIAGSLGVILGGSLIVETVFGIDGFGLFFYQAIINRDYNVIMFSAIAGAFLSLLGYLLADIAYTILDPRVTLD